MLLAAHIIEKERERAFAEGFREGLNEVRRGRRMQELAKARQEGMDKAYEDVDRQMAPYYRRMRAALDAGEPFNEPPPMFRRNGQ